MKNYLLCILIALPNCLEAQTLPTQIQNYEWSDAFFDWVLRTSESYQYDERDSVRVIDEQNNIFGPTRNIYTKDESGKIVERLSLVLDTNNVWRAFYRTTYTASGDNTEIILQESIVNGQWQGRNLSTIRTQITAAGIETDHEFQTLVNDEWVNHSRYFNLRNEADVIIKEINQVWENDHWVVSFFLENKYNEQGDQVYYEYSNILNGYTQRVRWTYTYTSAIQPLTVKQEQANTDPPDWHLIMVDSFGYDSQGRQSLHYKTWASTNKVRLEEIEYRGDTTVWSAKQSFNGAMLEEIDRRWIVEGLEKYGPYVFLRVDEWINGAWSPKVIERRTFSFDQYENLVREDYEKWVDKQWDAQSYQSYNWEYRDDGKPIKMVSLYYNFISQQQTPLEKTIWRYEDRKKGSDRPMIEISPNPSIGPLNIDFHTAMVLPIRWKLIDESGRLVRSGDISAEAHSLGLYLYIEELQFGLYILQIQYEDGSTVAKKWQKI